MESGPGRIRCVPGLPSVDLRVNLMTDRDFGLKKGSRSEPVTESGSNEEEDLIMTLAEFFADIREPYVSKLAEAVAAVDAHVEPALRKADGSLALDGHFRQPFRADFIPKGGDGRSVMVSSDKCLNFEPIVVDVDSCHVEIQPFVWDWVELSVEGISGKAVISVGKAWFPCWFDSDDTNEADEQGLYGVVHYIGDPKAIDEGFELTIDMGSAPPEALEDLITRLAQAGAKRMTLSS